MSFFVDQFEQARVAKETVKQAKAKWPAILRDAPDNLRRSVEQRLAHGVALAR